MPITGNSNLASSQAQYEAQFAAAYSNAARFARLSDLAANKFAVNGKTVVSTCVLSQPRVREWQGAKIIKSLRAYSKTHTLLPYESTIGIKRMDVEYDLSGSVQNRINSFLASGVNMVEDILLTNLLANTWTGYDGSALLADAHANTNSTGDNLTTSALSHETYRAGIQAMAQFTDEDGTPLNMRPTHLVVGPKQERIAMDVTAAMRPLAVSNAGAYDGTSNVVGGVAYPNAFAGLTNLIISPWITGNQWFLMDLSTPGLFPFNLGIGREVTPYVKDGSDMTADSRFLSDQYYYGLEGEFFADCGYWPAIYGSVSA